MEFFRLILPIALRPLFFWRIADQVVITSERFPLPPVQNIHLQAQNYEVTNYSTGKEIPRKRNEVTE